MGRRLQLVVLGTLTVPGVALLGPAAWAQPAGTSHTVKPQVLQTAWYWQTAYQQVNPPVAPPAAPPTEPSGVPQGDLAVATTSGDGTSTKSSAIAFHLGGLTQGATVTAFTLSITLDSGPSATQVNSGAAPVLACLPTRLWTPSEGGSYTNQPTVDCATSAKPTIKGSTYTYSIADIAQQWVGGPNLGVALVNDPTNTAPFQAVFTAKSITASMSYTLPVVPPPNGHTGQLGGTGAGNGNGSAVGGSSGGAGTTAVAPPAPVNLPPTGPTTTTNPVTPAQPPQVATTTATAVAAHKPASSMPSTAFWVAALAIALLMVVSGVVLADDNVRTPTATTTRLSRVLRARERARAHAKTESPANDGLPALSPRRA